jgi:hypothetical protein
LKKFIYINFIIYCIIENEGLMANLILLTYYIIALLVKLVELVKQPFWSKKQILSPKSISIIDVLEAILTVFCEVDSTDYKIKALITEAIHIIVSAKFGYCSKVPNIKYDKEKERDRERAIYENEWLENWFKNPSNITKTYFVFLQVEQKFHLLSEIKQINDTDKDLIHDALKKIDEWMVSQTVYDVSILVT